MHTIWCQVNFVRDGHQMVALARLRCSRVKGYHLCIMLVDLEDLEETLFVRELTTLTAEQQEIKGA